MKIISGYIRRSVIQSTLLCLLVLIGVQCFINLINISGDLGKGSLSLGMAVLVVLMKLPADLYQMFPMVGFVGCLLGLGRLSSNSELIVIRASGVSIARIALSVVSAAAIMIALMTLVGEVVAPSLSESAQYIKHPDQKHGEKHLHDIWLHEGMSFVFIERVKSSDYIQSVAKFDLDSHHHVTAYWKAAYAVKKNHQWFMKDVTLLKVGQSSRFIHYQSHPFNVTIQPDMLVKKKIDLRDESVSYLWGKFHYLKKVGLDQGQVTFTLWQHIMQPFTTIVMICLGVPFTLGSLRDSSSGARMVIGVLIGFGFYMLNEFLGPIAFIYQVPAAIAAVLPSFLFLTCYVIMLRRID